MSQAEISELERLANQSHLVAPLRYQNSNREGKVFYEFVKNYGAIIGIPVSEKRIGFIDTKKIQLKNIGAALTNSRYPNSVKLFYGTIGGLGLIASLTYPIMGTEGYTINEENQIIICIPKFKGLRGLFWEDKPHDYMHGYHALVAKDLRARGLLQHISGYLDIGIIEPPQRVPTFKSLKKFERKFLHAMIKKEKKYL